MDHTQTVFLGHFIPMAFAFWLYCWYHFEKNKKSIRRANAKQTNKKIFQRKYITMRNT